MGSGLDDFSIPVTVWVAAINTERSKTQGMGML